MKRLAILLTLGATATAVAALIVASKRRDDRLLRMAAGESPADRRILGRARSPSAPRTIHHSGFAQHLN